MSLDQTIFHARAAIQASNHTIPGSEQLKAFQASLIVACDAIIDATRVWPNIASLARISAEVLDVPSSSDELGCAHMISFNGGFSSNDLT